MFDMGNILFVFRGARTSLHHRRKKLIVEKRSTVVLQNLIRDIQSALHPNEHAQLPLIVLLYQYDALRSLRQFLEVLSAEWPEICVVQVRDPPLAQLLAANYVLDHVMGAPPADHEQLVFV